MQPHLAWSFTGTFYLKWRWLVGHLHPPFLTQVHSQLEPLPQHHPAEGLLAGWEVSSDLGVTTIGWRAITPAIAGQEEVGATTVVRRGT